MNWFLSGVVFFLSLSVFSADYVPFSVRNEFVNALAADGDRIYAAYEEVGVAVIEGGKELRLLDAPPLKEGVFSLAVGRDGQLWIGTNSAGIAVWNGREYRYITPAQGLPGVHVYALYADAKGNIWGGAENGAFAIHPDGRAESFPAPFVGGRTRLTIPEELREITAIAGDADGNVYLGAAAGGVLKLERRGGGHEISGHYPCLTGRVNSLLMDRKGFLWVAQDGGVTVLKPPRKEARFHLAKMFSKDAKLPKDAFNILPEHYVNAVVELGCDRYLLCGREKSCVVDLSGRGAPTLSKAPMPEFPDSFFKCATPRDGELVCGFYGGGVCSIPLGDFGGVPKQAGRKAAAAASGVKYFDPFTQKLAVPAMDARLAVSLSAGREGKGASVFYLGEDWSSRGNWFGNYGRTFHVLCGYFGCPDYRNGGEEFWEGVRKGISPASPRYPGYYPWLGTKGAVRDDSLRHWMHWRSTGNPKCLEGPVQCVGGEYSTGPRRHSEWDDHSETYSAHLDGPSMFCDVAVPEGWWALSMHFMNKDAHFGEWVDEGERRRNTDNKANRRRDYTIEIKGFPEGAVFPDRRIFLPSDDSHRLRKGREERYDGLPLLSSARVHDFRTSVWKRFLLKGPASYTVKFARNRSFCTIVSGLFLDPAFPPDNKNWIKTPIPVSYSYPGQDFGEEGGWGFCGIRGAEPGKALEAFNALDAVADRNPVHYFKALSRNAGAMAANLGLSWVDVGAYPMSEWKDVSGAARTLGAAAILHHRMGWHGLAQLAERGMSRGLVGYWLDVPGGVSKELVEKIRERKSREVLGFYAQLGENPEYSPRHFRSLSDSALATVPCGKRGYMVRNITDLPVTNRKGLFSYYLLSGLGVSGSEIGGIAMQLPPRNRYALALICCSAPDRRNLMERMLDGGGSRVADMPPALAQDFMRISNSASVK